MHYKYVQKIGCQIVWLGFPKGNLADFESEAKENGLQWNVVDENHIVVSGCTKLDKFDSWKQGVISNVSKPPSAGQVSLYAFRNTAKVAKEFKYGLADNIREDVLLLVKSLHLNVNGLECLDSKEIGLSLKEAGWILVRCMSHHLVISSGYV